MPAVPDYPELAAMPSARGSGASASSLRYVLPTLGLLAASLAIASAPWALDRPWLNFAFKPLATLCVIVWCMLSATDDPRLKRWLVAGLLCSLAGDIALLWPVSGFLAGLVSFLFAHVAYLLALTSRVSFGARPAAFAAWGLVAAAVLRVLWAGVPADLHVPVVVYVCALAAMAAQASTVWLANRRGADAARWFLVALGGALFVFSDAVLALDKFRGGVSMPTLWNLAAYWLGQWLIASGAWRRHHSLDSPWR
jgi:uncharacterized membrane protein YhhN